MRKAIPVLVFLLLVPALGLAQSARDSWDNVKQLRRGQKIEVVDSSMKTLKGAFVSVSAEAISLEAGKTGQSVARADVIRVSVRDTSHRTRNMVLGAAVAGDAALLIGLLANAPASNEGTDRGGCVTAFAAAAAVGGAGLGALPGEVR